MKKVIVFFALFVITLASWGQNTILINEIMSANIDCYLSPATNFDGWIELYNPNSEEFKLSGIYISDSKDDLKKWQFPEDMPSVPSRGYAVIWFDSNEINKYEPPFKLDIDGGYVIISDQLGSVIASQEYPAAINRTSYSRKTNDGLWGITCYPSPGKVNSTEGYFDSQLKEPIVDLVSQLFDSTIDVNVTIPSDTKLIYTIDGSLPTLENGYESTDGHFSFSSTTPLRVRLFKDGFFPSEPVTRTFIKCEYDFKLPVVSVYTNNDYLYDDSIGIWVEGVNGRIDNGSVTPCNWNMDWERPASFSFMKNGKSVFEQDVLIKINGHWSRKKEVKSLKVKGSKIFGKKTLDYLFFEDKPYIRNRSLILRNGGSGYGNKLKDSSLETIILKSGIDMDLQAYTPAQYYLNGKFMGLINMREPTNDHYVYANYGYDDEEIDMFEMNSKYIQLCGDSEAHDRWYELSANAADNDVYQEIKNIVDIDEYINYLASHLYLKVDGSWPLDNTKCFRPKDGGRFRYLSYDMDAAFRVPIWSLMDSYQNYSPSVIFFNMLKNDVFRKNFIDKFCIMGGSVFSSKNAEKIIDNLTDRVTPIMEWANELPAVTAAQLKVELDNCRETMVEDLIKFTPLGLKNGDALRVSINSDIDGAQLFLNQTNIPLGDFDGVVFKPAVITAIAPAGYRFEGWKANRANDIENSGKEFTLDSDITTLTACFTKDDTENMTLPVVINEISADNDSYINDNYKKSDWVELYNISSSPIDIEGLYLSNDESDPYKYKIEKDENVNTVIPAHGFIIIWCDNQKSVSQLHAPFKLSAKGGIVTLADKDRSLINRVDYDAMDKTVSVGRYPDGGGGVYRMNSPTIGKNNLFTCYMVSEHQTSTGFKAPVINDRNGCSVELCGTSLVLKTNSNRASLSIYSLTGQKLVEEDLTINGESSYLIDGISKGCYIAKAVDGFGDFAIIKFAVNK